MSGIWLGNRRPIAIRDRVPEGIQDAHGYSCFQYRKQQKGWVDRGEHEETPIYQILDKVRVEAFRGETHPLQWCHLP